ncbi:hypothetical protein, partial [Bacillus licheniformis]|uniref:hypothetical protein n=1 Tax=Bacillus licheniformis TaxID=1402 RepID=UPI00237D1C5A
MPVSQVHLGNQFFAREVSRVKGRFLGFTWEAGGGERRATVPSMSAQRYAGPVLPDGEVRDLYVVDGRVTYEPQAGAETVAEGWIVPGLVDAHCHLGLDE